MFLSRSLSMLTKRALGLMLRVRTVYSKNPTSALQVARINKQQHRLRRARYTFRGLSTKLQALALLWPGDPLVLIPLGSTGTNKRLAPRG